MAMIAAGGAALQGSVDNSITVELRNTSDNLEATGKVAADFNIRYWRPLLAVQVVSPLSDLAAVTTAHTDGGIKELDATNMKGQYRVDLPDAAFGSGVPYVLITVQVAGCWTFPREIPLTPAETPWTMSVALMTLIADTLLKRDMAAVESVSPAASRSPLNALRRLRNRWLIAGTTNTVMKEDDATPAFTETLTSSSSATPIVGADPS